MDSDVVYLHTVHCRHKMRRICFNELPSVLLWQMIIPSFGRGSLRHSSLLNVIRSAHHGDILISPYLARLTLKNLETPSSHSGIHLTSREKDVLNLIIGGHENDAIAEALAMSRDTLKTHLKHIFEKLQVNNRTQCAVKALEKGIIPVKKN